MKRLIVFSAAIVILLISGCDLLFYKAEEVEVSNLSSFDSNLTVPQTREDVEIALLGTSLEDMASAARSAIGMTSIASELKNSIPGMEVILGDATLPLVLDGGSRSGQGGVNVSVENEVFEIDTVTVTLEKAEMKLKAEVDSVQQPTTGTASFDGSLALQVEDTSEFANVTDVVVNAIAKGKMEVDLEWSTDEWGDYVSAVSAYANFKAECKVGLTLNDTGNGVGGKFLISAKLWTEVNVDVDENDTDPPDLANQMSSLELTVNVYDNNNSLVASYVYTAEELSPLFDQMF
jgi:hypothetical protein